MKLFLYEHCPYCVRPRIVAGLKSLKLDLIYLANDDEKAHFAHIDEKQVPFLQKDNGEYLIESLLICQHLNDFDHKPILADAAQDQRLMQWTETLSHLSKLLIYPRFIDHPRNHLDFPTKSAKAYFQRKKEMDIGCFTANLRFPEAAIDQIRPVIAKINSLMMTSFATSNKPSWDDIYIFPALRNCTLITDLIDLPENIQNYLDFMSKKTEVALYTEQKHH